MGDLLGADGMHRFGKEIPLSGLTVLNKEGWKEK